jgi:hypothetical protein
MSSTAALDPLLPSSQRVVRCRVGSSTCRVLHPSPLFVLSTIQLPCIVHSCLVQLPRDFNSCLTLFCPPPHCLVECPLPPSSYRVACHPIILHCPPSTCLMFPLLHLVTLSVARLPCIIHRPLLLCHPLPAHPINLNLIVALPLVLSLPPHHHPL